MMKFEYTGLKELQAELKDFSERRLKAAAATALTRTAVEVRNATQAALRTSLDRPTPYTVRQLRYTAAKADRLVAAVGFNIAPIQDVYGNVVSYQDLGSGETPAGRYLTPQTDGGKRGIKRFERALQAVGLLPAGWQAVPGSRAKMDSYGNMSVGEIRQILSWFDAAELVAGTRQNMRAAGRDKRRKGTRTKAGWEYFAVRPGSIKGGLKPGIYRRTKMAMGARIDPVVMFVRGASYRPRFPFYEIAQTVGNATLPREMERAIAESVARLASKGSGA